MKRVIATGAALALLAVPTGAVAKPDDTDRSNAAKECKAERGSTPATREAFKAKYGNNKNKRNAFGKCVSQRAKAKEHEAAADAEDQEQIEVRKNAAKTCAAEREEIGDEAFAEKHGTNKSKSNAFGKCVSKTAKAQQDDEPQS